MPENARSCTVATAPAQNEATPPAPPTPPAGAQALLPRQLTAIDLLFDGYSFARVCAALGIDAKTLYRWRRLPAFAAEIRRRYAAHQLARRPPSPSPSPAPPPSPARRASVPLEPLIPPRPPCAVAAKVFTAERERRGVRDTAYWKAVVGTDPYAPLPPPRGRRAAVGPRDS